MLVLKAIRFFWPFLKEMFLGGKTLREAARLHFGRLLFVLLFLGSIAVNAWLFPRLLDISLQLVELKRSHSALLKKCYPNSDPAGSDETEPASPAVKPAASQPAADDHYNDTLEFFRRLQQREYHLNNKGPAP